MQQAEESKALYAAQTKHLASVGEAAGRRTDELEHNKCFAVAQNAHLADHTKLY